MPPQPSPARFARHPWWLGGLWLLTTALLLGLQIWQERLNTQRQQTELTQTVQSQMLEKIAQHKAHLTALTALARRGSLLGLRVGVTGAAGGVGWFAAQLAAWGVR